MTRKIMCLVVLLTFGAAQLGCAAVAGGVAGAAVGHAVVKHERKKDNDKD